MNYDPYRIRFYNKRFFGFLAISTAFVSPLIIDCFVPEYTGPHKGQKEFQDRTVIVTGATGNVGASICLHYAKRKFRLIMACRDMDECKILRRQIVLCTRNNSIACRHLDLEDIDSINNFANDMIKNEPHINVLVNNAAVKQLKEKQITKYGIEKMYFVNFLAPYLLTFKLLDKLEKTAEYFGDSRIINVIGKPKKNWKLATSDINFDKRKYTSDAAYKQSKFALAYFTILLERHNKDKGNNVYVYGTSPCFKSIRESVNQPTSALEQARYFTDTYHTISGLQASSTAAMCGIEHDMADRAKSGRLYTYFMSSSSWGIAGKDDDKAKHVWNHASKLLLAIPEASKRIDPEHQIGNTNQVVQKPNQDDANEDDQKNKV